VALLLEEVLLEEILLAQRPHHLGRHTASTRRIDHQSVHHKYRMSTYGTSNWTTG
jgi:hypothetical protein